MLWNTIACLRDQYTIPLIATCAEAREYDVGPDDFERLAGDLGATFIRAPSLNTEHAITALRASKCDVAVSVNWCNVIRAEARASFPHGIWNAHAGDVPKYRGNAPVAWAILNGEREVGVTVHEMVEELDAGPVLGKRFVPLGDHVYIGTVFEALETVVPELFRECIDALAAGALRPRPQSGVVVRGYPRRPEDGRIDWRDSAERIARLVRASAEPFGGAFCAFGDDRLTIWRAHAEPYAHGVRATPGQVMYRCPEQGTVHVATVSGAIVLETVEYRDAGRLPAATAIRSNRSRLA